MLISYNLLKKHVNLVSVDPKELAEKLKASTVEVEGLQNQGELLQNVVVGKVTVADKHPNAETEEVLQYIMSEMRVKGDEKVGAVVGASRALKERGTGKTNKEIVQELMDKSGEILLTIGEN